MHPERFRCEHHFVVDASLWTVYSFFRASIRACGGREASEFPPPYWDREPGWLEAERTVSADDQTGGKIRAEVVESL
jgi:hypothetical protein